MECKFTGIFTKKSNWFCKYSNVTVSLMISTDRHGFSGRTYEDDDELDADEWPEDIGSVGLVGESITSCSSVRLVFESEYSNFISQSSVVPRHIRSAVFCTDKHSAVCSNAFINSLTMVEVGSIRGVVTDRSNANTTTYATLFYSEESSLMLIVTGVVIPDGSLVPFAQLFEVFTFSLLIVLGNVDVTKRHQSDPVDDQRLYRIRSTQLNELPTDSLHLEGMDAIDLGSIGVDLEVGTLVTGVSAALFNFAELRSCAAMLLLTPSRVFLSVASMRVFEQALPLFKILTDGRYTNPTQRDYQSQLRRDPYVFKTENLYC